MATPQQPVPTLRRIDSGSNREHALGMEQELQRGATRRQLAHAIVYTTTHTRDHQDAPGIHLPHAAGPPYAARNRRGADHPHEGDHDHEADQDPQETYVCTHACAAQRRTQWLSSLPDSDLQAGLGIKTPLVGTGVGSRLLKTEDLIPTFKGTKLVSKMCIAPKLLAKGCG